MSIKIKKCLTADKTVHDESYKKDLLIAIAGHINDVQKGCAFIANKLIEAGINHDYTKIPTVDEYIEECKSGVEINKGEWYQTHINKERHHLNNCSDDVTLIDVIECLVDCVMAGMARNGHYREGPMDIAILQKAYLNTAKMLKSEIIIEDD